MKYDQLHPEKVVQRVLSSLNNRGINSELVNTKEEALNRLIELIPLKAEIMTAGSTTLEEIGFINLLKSSKHKWKNLKDELLSEKNELKQEELRKKSVTAEFFIGSVHAVTEKGEVLVASASGSQIPAYSFSSDNLIWIVGVQKIVSNLNEGFKRIREYVKNLIKTLANIEYAKQLIKSSSSVGANYIEAEESLSKKDFVIRIKICRKEAKESRYWLELIEPEENQIQEKETLSREATELTKIFGSIVEKSKV